MSEPKTADEIRAIFTAELPDTMPTIKPHEAYHLWWNADVQKVELSVVDLTPPDPKGE